MFLAIHVLGGDGIYALAGTSGLAGAHGALSAASYQPTYAASIARAPPPQAPEFSRQPVVFSFVENIDL
jgi:hypothetical protein